MSKKKAVRSPSPEAEEQPRPEEQPRRSSKAWRAFLGFWKAIWDFILAVVSTNTIQGESDKSSLGLTLFGLTITQGVGIVFATQGEKAVGPLNSKILLLSAVALAIWILMWRLICQNQTKESEMFNRTIFGAATVLFGVVYVSAAYGKLPLQVTYDSSYFAVINDGSKTPGLFVEYKLTGKTLKSGVLLGWIDKKTIKTHDTEIVVLDDDGLPIQGVQLITGTESTNKFLLFRLELAKDLSANNFCTLQIQLRPSIFRQEVVSPINGKKISIIRPYEKLNDAEKEEVEKTNRETKERLEKYQPFRIAEVEK